MERTGSLMKTKHTLLRTAAALLALVLLLLSAVSCSGRGKALMTLKKDGVSVSLSINEYELMLSRMKGSLSFYGVTKNGATALEDAFWEVQDKFDGENFQTHDEYYRATILENAKAYLAAAYLFEKNGLSLSETQRQEIADAMTELLRVDGDGSKTKLNSVLANYGMNYAMLEDFYELEQKMTVLKSHLYGENAEKVGDVVKTEYMNDHYVHFKQIFLASYLYVCETDKNGDVIYYRTEEGSTNRIYYDADNGEARKLEDGSLEKDKNGDVIYYVKGSDYGHIAYNVKGKTTYVATKDGSDYEKREMTADELKALESRANTLLDEVKGLSSTAFEAKILEESDDTADNSEYGDGYYLRRDLDYTASGESYAYLDSIVEKLDTMQEGEVTMVKSNFGYHIVKKYAHTEKAYENEANEAWFENFNARLIDELFLAECQALYADIKIDEAILAKAPSMKEVAPNYNY